MKYKFYIFSTALSIIILISCSIKRNHINVTQYNLDNTNKMDSLISILKSDMNLHKDVYEPISEDEIQRAEMELKISLPPSYKCFLKEFGNGAYWLYTVDQPINGVNKKYGQIHWLGEYRKHLDDKIETDGFGTFNTNQLLCLMTENSNGGAWCWITTEYSENGEWPIAYYSIDDQKLYYKVSNFIEWLKIATKCKEEVIRELDVEYRLGLG